MKMFPKAQKHLRFRCFNEMEGSRPLIMSTSNPNPSQRPQKMTLKNISADYIGLTTCVFTLNNKKTKTIRNN